MQIYLKNVFSIEKYGKNTESVPFTEESFLRRIFPAGRVCFPACSRQGRSRYKAVLHLLIVPASPRNDLAFDCCFVVGGVASMTSLVSSVIARRGRIQTDVQAWRAEAICCGIGIVLRKVLVMGRAFLEGLW